MKGDLEMELGIDYSKKILVIKGEAMYEVLRRASDEICRGFENRGYQVTIIDVENCNEQNPEEEQSFLIKLAEEMSKPYAFVFSCQAVASDFMLCKPDGEAISILELMKAPYLGWIFDHPNEHLGRLEKVHGKEFHLGVIDRKHEFYIKKYMENIKNTFFLPHGGFDMQSANLSYADREIEIFCPGTVGEEMNVEEVVKLYGNVVKTIYEGVYRLVKQNPDMAVYEALERYLVDLGMEWNKEGFLQLKFIMELVENNIRYECKKKAVELLLKAGKKVIVAGKGWETLKELYPEHLVIATEEMDIGEVIQYMQRSKIVLNLAPTYNEGMHERTLTGLLAKAAVITPYHSYISNVLEPCKSLFYFSMNQMEQLPDLVGSILAQSDMEERTKISYEYIKTYHTWEKRGEEIVDYAEHLRGEENA